MFQKFAQYEKASGVFIKNKNSPVSCHVDPVSADLLQGLEICIYKIPKYPRAKVLRQFAIFLQCSGVWCFPSFIWHLLSFYCIPGTGLGAGHPVWQARPGPCPEGVTLREIYNSLDGVR